MGKLLEEGIVVNLDKVGKTSGEVKDLGLPEAIIRQSGGLCDLVLTIPLKTFQHIKSGEMDEKDLDTNEQGHLKFEPPGVLGEEIIGRIKINNMKFALTQTNPGKDRKINFALSGEFNDGKVGGAG